MQKRLLALALIGLVVIGLSSAQSIDEEKMRRLHAEYRWAEGKLMQASERLAEAQESRRKDDEDPAAASAPPTDDRLLQQRLDDELRDLD